MTNAVWPLYRQALEALERQVAALVAHYGEQLQCRKGCSDCCRDAFKIRPIEALALQAGLRQAPADVAQRIQEQVAQPGPCPVLIDGACALYEHRPFLCRAYGVPITVSGETGVCGLNFQHGPAPTQALDLTPFYAVLDELSQSQSGEAVGPQSIRAFLATDFSTREK